MNLLDLNWGLLAPEFTIVILATIITLADLVMRDKGDRRIFGWVSVIGIAVAIYFTVQQLNTPVEYLLENTYRVDSFGTLFKLIFLAGTGVVFIMSINYIDKKEIKHDGEYYYLLLTALLGAMMMASSVDLITLYIGLELLSISSYILVGLRKKNLKSNEAAFKYVVTGGVSSAIFLYGASFIYGLTGTSNMFLMAERLPEVFATEYDFFIYLGFFMMLVGLSYKISIVPSYMWAPDVYEGAPTPITAFLSVISKAAGFAIIIRIALSIFTPLLKVDEADPTRTISFLADEITLFLAVLAGITMLVGNTLALRQTNVKRILAFSSVAQAGYLVVPLASMKYYNEIVWENSIANIMFYLFAYLLMNLGIFTVATIVNRDAGTENVSSFSGLYHRSPALGIATTFFLLSLAGLPITAGFIGKFNIFVGALFVDSYWLAGVMLVTSVISYFYYFNIARQMYMRPGHTEAKLRIPLSYQAVILVAVLGTFLAGLFPNVFLDFFNSNFNILDMFTLGIMK